jgi:hypothetical protein
LRVHITLARIKQILVLVETQFVCLFSGLGTVCSNETNELQVNKSLRTFLIGRKNVPRRLNGSQPEPLANLYTHTFNMTDSMQSSLASNTQTARACLPNTSASPSGDQDLGDSSSPRCDDDHRASAALIEMSRLRCSVFQREKIAPRSPVGEQVTQVTPPVSPKTVRRPSIL